MSKRRELSGRQGLALVIVAIAGIVACLYLATFAGVLLVAYRTGEVVIKADSLMFIESLLLLWASACMASIVLYSLRAMGSDIRIAPKQLHGKTATSAITAAPDRVRAALSAEAKLTGLPTIQEQVP